MANGGFGVTEEYLVKGRHDGSEVERGIPASVDKGVAGASKGLKTYSEMLRGAHEDVVRIVSGQKAAGVSANEMAREFMKAGRTQEIASKIMEDSGYSAKETTKAFKSLKPEVEETETAFDRVAKSIKWAAYRFVTTLIVYQAFRKILRAINDALSTAIRLYREWSQTQQVLKTSLEVNNQLLEVQVGTLQEWNEWAKKSSQTFGTSTTAWTKAINVALDYNATLGLTRAELEDLIELGMSVAQMWSMYKDGQLDVERGTKTVMEAVQGESSALQKLAIREEDVATFAEMTVVQFHAQSDAFQETVRWAYIVENRYEAIAESASKGMTDIEKSESRVKAANDGLMVSWGNMLSRLSAVGSFLKLVALGPLVKIAEGVDTFNTAVMRSGKEMGTRFKNALESVGIRMSWLGAIIDRFTPSVLKAAKAEEILSEETKKTSAAALAATKVWLFYQGIIARVPGIVKDATSSLMDMVEQVKEAAQPFIDLGKAIGETMLGYFRSLEDAAKGFAERIAKLGIDMTRDLAKMSRDFENNLAKIGRKYAARAQELILGAEDKKAETRRKFDEREEKEREALNLKLRHMEEDHLLSLRQLRGRFELDLEGAARTRDAIAIRTLQRRYGLERKEQQEKYALERRQFIESWELQKKTRKEDLKEALQEVEDGLQDQLDALERAKQQEIEELKISDAQKREELRIQYRQRKEDLDIQYAQEREDLKANLERRLADILGSAQAEGTIRVGEAEKIVQSLATWYNIDASNIENKVRHDAEWWSTWAGAYEAAASRIAQARNAISGTLPAFGPGYGKIPQLEFAEGGMAIATSPTIVKVGEAGPELFGAIPLGGGGKLGRGGQTSRSSTDVRLTMDGTQSGAWSGDLETQVLRIIRKILQESL